VQPGRPARDGALCRAVIGHPELSTRGQLLVSYFDPGNYHVEVSAYPWLSHDRLVLPVSNFLAAHPAEPQGCLLTVMDWAGDRLVQET